MENIIQYAIQSMEWMIKDIDYKNSLDESPCDSPELIKAKEILKKLKELNYNMILREIYLIEG